METQERPSRRCRGEHGELRLPVLIAAGAAIVLAAVLAVRVGTWVTTDRDHPDVLVLGDSITDRAQALLRRSLGTSWDVSVDGVSGMRSDEQLVAARSWATRPFDQVIVQLGTNDVAQGRPTAEIEATLVEIVSLFPAARCVHLVTVNEALQVNGADVSAAAVELNAAIRSIQQTDPRVSVVDWQSVFAGGFDEDGEPLLVDGVHPGAAGNDLLVDAYRSALRACGPPPQG